MGIFTFPALLKRRASGILVPSGLIIPYNGTSAPSGWSLFTDADGRFIIGAGNSYSVGATGGSTSVTTNASDTQGTHSGSSVYGGAATDIRVSYTNAAGGHTHTLTFNYEPPYYGLRLIKASSELSELPANAVMFAGNTMSGLTRFSSGDGKLFSARSSIGSGGSNTIGATTSSSDGTHTHGYINRWATQISSSGYIAKEVGAHTHSNSSFAITPNLYRVLLSAWTNASNAFNLQPGMYAFWESTTIMPDGWYLCNGANGTLDLRNYFIQFSDEDSDGTKTGNGTIDLPNISLASEDWTHDHRDASTFYAQTYYHGSYSATHSHTITAQSGKAYTPPYYALAIIQLAS
jgi:hypothetical protein